MQTSVLEYLEHTAARLPDKAAFFDDKKIITFRELRNLSLNLSLEIENAIGASHRPVLICLPKAAESIIAFMGTLYSGNFYTPTDQRFPKEKLAAIADALKPAAVIGNTAGMHKIKEIKLLRALPFINIEHIDQGISARDSGRLIERILDTDPVYVFFTSGSTGVPKGVIINNHNIIDYIDWACEKFDIHEHTVMGNQSPFYFDISTQDIYAALKTGASLGIIPSQYFAFPVKALEFISRNKINFLYWVPSAYIHIANLKLLDEYPLPDVRLMMFGGEVMPVKHLHYWQEHLTGLKTVINVYGPTEATVNCTYYIADRTFSEDEALPLGSACGNTGLLVLDENDREILPDKKNVPGELCVYGSSLSAGYWMDNEKTAEKFIPNPLNHSYRQTIYRTGDLVFYNDRGELAFAGRKDFQIKHLGFRIELGEIETAAGKLDGVENVLADYHTGKKEIVMFYQGNIDKNALQEILYGILPKYMVPTIYYKLDRFPYNDNGKTDRMALRKEYIDD